MANRITCITKPQEESSREAIQYVGGKKGYGAGNSFHISRRQCALEIHNRTGDYYVHEGEFVMVAAYQKGGDWYIRTKPEDPKHDKLLTLPRCAASQQSGGG